MFIFSRQRRRTVHRNRRPVALQLEQLEDRTVPALLGQQLFPSDNPWNQQITNAPVAANSAAILSAITSTYGDGRLHPDFGQDYQNSSQLYGIPYNVVHGNTTPKVNVVLGAYASESDPQAAPIPANAVLEGDHQNGPTVGLANRGDSHLLIYDVDNNVAYEFFQASRPSENSDGKWHAAQETVWHLNTDEFRTLGWTSADAAGLPILPGLARPDEGLPVSQGGQGVIKHALRITLKNAVILNQFLYPASHTANPGNTLTATEPPMGARLRLKASVDISSLDPESRIIAQALKDYGAIVADNGSNFFLSGASDAVNANNGFALTWSDSDILDTVHGLESLHFSDFEVVNLTPVLTGLSTASAQAGTTLTITGQNFSGAAGHLQVLFGSTPATSVTVVDDQHVTAVVPAGSGTVDVRVQSGVSDPNDLSDYTSPIFGYGISALTTADRFTYAGQTTLTWTGGGSTSNWSNPNNWGGVTPVAGDTLIFGPGASSFTSNNDLAAGTSFNSITFTGAGYTVSGNSVVLTGGVDGSQATGNNSLTLGISLASNETVQGGGSGTTLTLGGAINNQGNTLTVAGGSGAVVIDNTISGSGRLIENNTGNLTLSGTTGNTFTGLTTVQSGTLELDKTGALALAGPLTVGIGSGPAVAQWLASNQLASGAAVTVGSSATLDLNGKTNTVASLTLSGSTVQTEAGTLTLSGNVNASGTSTLSGKLALTSGSHSFTVSSASTLTASAIISGSASLNANGSGTLVLSGANTYSGGTKLSSGTLAVGNSAALGSGVLTVSGGTLSSSGGAQTLANAVTLASNLTTGNSSTLTFTGAVTLTGNRTVNVGTSAVATFTGSIGQSGTTPYSLTKSSPGTLILSSVNTYLGGTILSSGTLAVGSSGALSSGVLTVNGGTLSSSGGAQTLANAVTLAGNLAIGTASTLTFTGPVTLTGNRMFTINTGAVATFAGVIAQSGTTAYSLTQSGSGTLILSGANTYMGGTKLNSGTLAVGNSAALGSGVLTLNGGTLSSSGGAQTLANAVTFSSSSSIGASSTLTFTGAVTLTGSRSLNVGTGAAATIAGAIGQSGGSYSFTKTGVGTLILSGSNTYTGNTFVNAGTLLVNGSLGGGTVNVANGAILGGSGTMGPISVSSGGKLQPGAGGSPAILSTGNVTLTSGSTFSVALNGATPGAGGYDQLDASGNINLGGSTLNVSLGFTPAIGEAFTIIKNNGSNPISGTFKNLPEGSTFVSGGMTFQISYVGGSGHDVVLTRIA